METNIFCSLWNPSCHFSTQQQVTPLQCHENHKEYWMGHVVFIVQSESESWRGNHFRLPPPSPLTLGQAKMVCILSQNRVLLRLHSFHPVHAYHQTVRIFLNEVVNFSSCSSVKVFFLQSRSC